MNTTKAAEALVRWSENSSSSVTMAVRNVAEAYLSIVSNGRLFRVRALEWRLSQFRSYDESWVADTVLGPFYVRRDGDVCEWKFVFDTPQKCDSVQDGKAKAEARYLARLTAALEPVTQ